MVVHRHEPECHAERLVCLLQGQGHGEDLYKQNMTVDFISFEMLILCNSFMVHHYKPEYLVGKFDRCVLGRGHSEGSKCQ